MHTDTFVLPWEEWEELLLLVLLGERGLVMVSSDGGSTLDGYCCCITEELLLCCAGGTKDSGKWDSDIIPSNDVEHLSLLFMGGVTGFSLEGSTSFIIADIVELDELLLLVSQFIEEVLGPIIGLVIWPFGLKLRNSGTLVDNFNDFCFDICSVGEGTDCIIGVVGEFCSFIELDDDNWLPECGLCKSCWLL